MNYSLTLKRIVAGGTITTSGQLIGNEILGSIRDIKNVNFLNYSIENSIVINGENFSYDSKYKQVIKPQMYQLNYIIDGEIAVGETLLVINKPVKTNYAFKG